MSNIGQEQSQLAVQQKENSKIPQNQITKAVSQSRIVQDHNTIDKKTNKNSPSTPEFENSLDAISSNSKTLENKSEKANKTGIAAITIDGTILEDTVTSTLPADGKKSIFDAIAEQEDLKKEGLEKETFDRWALGPSVAPVYFDAVGEGSPIHSSFASNSKSGNLNLSYGLNVSYSLSKKLSVRSGAHMVDFGYDTNDISFTTSLQAPTSEFIDNITYSQASRNLVVNSANNNTTIAENPLADEFSLASNALNGRMVQDLGYIEVPMELNYALLDKKLGINVIGGVSSLFLIDNSISLESEGLVTELGRANNVNGVSFSTNIGLGFNYKFAKNIQFNLEPVFKYQLNTFTVTSGPFRPYTVGIYSGLQFKL